MNGVHDMGGMHGMGPVKAEANEPVFHEPWEGRVYALVMSVVAGPWARGRGWPSFRFSLERIPAAQYLKMSYYERWFEALLLNRVIESGFVTPAEISTGEVDPSRPLPTLLSRSTATEERDFRNRAQVFAQFAIGQRVRARNMNPLGHTRLPRYVRGKHGTVTHDHGVFNLQDTDINGHAVGRFSEHVYTVRFRSRELWGDRASERDVVYVDLWERYLDAA